MYLPFKAKIELKELGSLERIPKNFQTQNIVYNVGSFVVCHKLLRYDDSRSFKHQSIKLFLRKSAVA